MKIIRNIIAFLLSFILFMDIFLISIIITFNSLVKKDILPELVKSQASTLIDNFEIDNKEEVKEKLKDLPDIQGLDEMIDVAINEVIDCKSTGREISDEAIDKLYSFIDNNSDFIKSIAGEDVDINQFKSEENKKELKKVLNEGIKQVPIESDSTSIKIIDTYRKSTSIKYLIYLIIIAVVLTILIALVRWSYYKWMKDVGVPLLVSGINMGLSCIFTNVLLGVLRDTYKIVINIDYSNVIRDCIIFTVSGLLFLIIYTVFNKNKEASNN